MSALTCRDPEEGTRWRDLSQGYQDIAALFESLHRLAHGGATPQRAPAASASAAAEPARLAARTIAAGARAIAEPEFRKAG